MRAETGSSRPSVWDDRPRIDKAGQNRRSDGWKSDVYCQPRQVVYMTTQPKTDLPTHVTVRSTGRLSTVLCEQVSSVSTDRVNNYIGQVSEQEMKNIDIALMISLQLSGGGKTSKQYNETIQKQQEEIEYYRNKIQAMQQSLEEKKTEKPQEAAGETSEIVVRLETERDTYKALYEQLFERMLNGGTGK